MSKSTDYKNKFISVKYDRINLTVPKGTKDILKEHCEKNSMSVNGYIYSLIKKDLNINDNNESRQKEMDIFLF